MNCWHCGSALIWGGDSDCEDNDEFLIETNLSCPSCHSLVVFYLSKRHDEDIDQSSDKTIK